MRSCFDFKLIKRIYIYDRQSQVAPLLDVLIDGYVVVHLLTVPFSLLLVVIMVLCASMDNDALVPNLAFARSKRQHSFSLSAFHFLRARNSEHTPSLLHFWKHLAPSLSLTTY